MNCDPQAGAPYRPLSPKARHRFEETPGRHDAKLHLTLRSNIRLEQGFGIGGECAALSANKTPTVVKRLDERELLPDTREEQFIREHRVEHLPDFLRRAGGRVGIYRGICRHDGETAL